MPLLAIILASAGVGLLVFLALDWLDQRPAVKPDPESEVEPMPYADLATPYREALDTAFRIQQAAWIAEQQIHAETARQSQFGNVGSPGAARRRIDQ